MMDPKFSIGFKSGEFGGQIIELLSSNPNEARYCLVALAECEGAFSDWFSEVTKTGFQGKRKVLHSNVPNKQRS